MTPSPTDSGNPPLSEDCLVEVVRRLPTSVFVLTPAGEILLANPAVEETFGEGPNSLTGASFSELTQWSQPEVRSQVRTALKRAREEGSARLETRLLSTRSKPIHVDVTIEPICASEEHSGYLMVSVIDTSERVRTTTALREGEARFSALVDLIPQLVWSTTPDGYHDYFNQRWYDYTGMSREGEQGWNWKDFLHPDDYERSLEVWQHSLETGTEYEVEYRFRRASDGAYRWFIGRAMPMRRPDGTIARWFGTCTDVHEERMARDAARRSEARYRIVTRMTQDVVWDWDVNSDALWWNENLTEVFGLGPGEVATLEAWRDRIHPDDRERLTRSLRAALEDPETGWFEEYRFRRRDGSYAEVLDRGLVIRDSEGRPTNMLGSMSDVTERNRLEEELRRAQKLEAVGKLAGGVAHDFNNLLTVISNAGALAMESLPERSSARDDLAEVLNAASRASNLTRQLLAFSRRQVLQPSVLNLNQVAASSRTLLERLLRDDIRIEFRPEPDLMHVRADQGQVEQVIMNLALNARDAMPNGGTLVLETANVRIPPTAARGRPDVEPGRFVRLSVTDTGIGMDHTTRERLFEPFFTTKGPEGGTGLGLPTVQGIVGQSGGFIEVESAPDQGASFHIFFPATNEAAGRPAPAAEARPDAQGDRTRRTVLVVEDQEALRRVAARVLSRAGFDTLVASDGRAALEILQAEGEAIDLVLSDLVMPEMGGRELAERAMEEGIPIPFLFMSGYAEEEFFGPGHDPSVLRLIEKPFSPNDLVNAVSASLDLGDS